MSIEINLFIIISLFNIVEVEELFLEIGLDSVPAYSF